MYKSEFDKYLKANKSFSSYMFYGQSIFLIEQYSYLVSKLIAKDEDIEKLYFEEYNFKYAKNRLLQSSLFSSSNTLLIKVDKKIPKKELDELVNACTINQNSTLILACMGDADFKSMESSFTVKKNACAVRFFALKDTEAIGYLQNEAKRLNISYEIDALNHLYFMHKGDLSLSSNDLNKLAVLKEHITSKIVDLHCFGLGNVNFDKFLQELMSFKDVSQMLDSLLEAGMDKVFIVNQISSFVQQLFLISSHVRVNKDINPIDILGYKPPQDIWEARSKLAINIKPKDFLKIFDFLLTLELELKTLKLNDGNLFLQASIRKFTASFR